MLTTAGSFCKGKAGDVCVTESQQIVLDVFQALDRIPLIRAIINLIMDIIRDRVSQWIIERGGWVSLSTFVCL